MLSGCAKFDQNGDELENPSHISHIHPTTSEERRQKMEKTKEKRERERKM